MQSQLVYVHRFDLHVSVAMTWLLELCRTSVVLDIGDVSGLLLLNTTQGIRGTNHTLWLS